LNIDYEHKWNSDKGKALSRHQINEKKRLKEEEQKENEIKRKKEEQRLREEKEAKRRKIEEENRRKEREQSREREYKTNKSENNSNGDKPSDRFRLKGVSVDLNIKKEKERNSFNKLFGKDREDKKNDKEKHNKRKRCFSSSSSSLSSSSAKPVKKKVLPFSDSYKDPKLKMKPYVPLIHLNAKTARKYRCEELLQLIEESKSKKKTEKVSAKLEVDFNVHIEQEFEIKELKSDIDNILKNIDDEEDECIKKSNDNNKDEEQTKDTSEDQEQNDTNVSDISETPLVIDTTLNESLNPNETNKSDTIKESVPNLNEKTTNLDENLDNSKTVLLNEQIDDLIEMSSNNSKSDTNEKVVKNDVSLSLASNNNEANE
jgi:trichohyalin